MNNRLYLKIDINIAKMIYKIVAKLGKIQIYKI